MTTIYVVAWKYSDGSGFGIIRAFCDDERANDFRDLMAQHGDAAKTYLILPVSLHRDYQG